MILAAKNCEDQTHSCPMKRRSRKYQRTNRLDEQKNEPTIERGKYERIRITSNEPNRKQNKKTKTNAINNLKQIKTRTLSHAIKRAGRWLSSKTYSSWIERQKLPFFPAKSRWLQITWLKNNVKKMEESRNCQNVRLLQNLWSPYQQNSNEIRYAKRNNIIGRTRKINLLQQRKNFPPSY